MKLLKFFRENKEFSLVLAIFIIIYLFFLIKFDQLSDVWWDSASYIGIGKYIFSGGEIGVFETVKSIFLPLVLGFGWKIGFDPVIFGKIMIFILFLFSMLMLYLISIELFNKKIGIIALIILFFNPLFFLFIFRIYTEMMSICFILLALYFIIKYAKSEKYYFLAFSSLFCILVFLTKYPNIVFILPLEIFLLIRCLKNRIIFPIIIFNLSLFIFMIPFFAINYLIGKDFLYIFNLSQQYLNANWGHMFDFKAFPDIPKLLFANTSMIYFKSMLYLFNIILPFGLLGIYCIFAKKEENYLEKLFFILSPILVVFTYFEITYLKGERYILPIFPLFALICAFGLIKTKINFKIKFVCFIVYIIFSLAFSLAFFSNLGEPGYTNFFKYPPKNLSCNLVATSDPLVMLNDYKVIFPYEVYDKNWKGGYIEKYYPDCVFYFSCYQNGTKILDEIKMMNYSEVSIKDTGRCIYAILKK